MASVKSEAALSHCHKATELGNRISIHFLEFLSTVKVHPHGFIELSHDFLDTCRIMWSIEAGLSHLSTTNQHFPPDMIQEMDKKFRITFADFQSLDAWLTRFLEYERRGTVGKIQRGWRKMFADNDIGKMRDNLSRTREALRMSALVFQWSLGETKIDDSVGIGYTGLAAALDRLDKGRSVSNIAKLKSIEPHMNQALDEISAIDTASSLHHSQTHSHHSQSQSHHSHPHSHSHAQSPILSHSHSQSPIPPLPPILQLDRGSVTDLSPFHTRDDSSFHFPVRRTSISNQTISSANGQRERLFSQSDQGGTRSTQHSGAHSATSVEDQELFEQGPIKAVHIKADPYTMPRWSPRSTVAANTPAMKAALVSAIHERNSKMVEQLLDRGVSADTGPDYSALREAALRHDLETIRILLLFGADPNATDKSGITPLFSCVEESFLDGAAMLLKYGAEPNLAAGAELETPLGLAVLEEKFNLIKLLLTYGGDVNHITSSGDTVLIKSISKTKASKFVKVLLAYGADTNLKNREGKTALFEAITSGRADIVTALLDGGADPNLPGPKHMLWPSTYQTTCLKLLLQRGADTKKAPGIMELAVSVNNIESVRVLLNAGVDPNAKKDGVYTPLCSSIRDNRTEIFQLLLANGADPNCPASEYPAFKCVTHRRLQFLPALKAAGADLNSPKGIIETAVQFNNMEALKWLLDAGVSPNDKVPKTGATALTTAIREDRLEMVDILLKHGADPNIRGQDWPVCMAVKQPAILRRLLPALAEPRAFKGVMEMAVVANQLESIKLLLAAGVSVEDRNGGVFSPLTTAIRERRKEITKFLLDEAHADPNAPGEHLPIVKALRRYEQNDTEIIEMLLAKKADPNKIYRGHSAFIQAIENGDAHVLQLLVDKCGVDIEAKDDDGRTILEISDSRGWDEGSDILIKGRKIR